MATCYMVTLPDGRTITVTIPPPECRACSGEGRRWNPKTDRFENATCPECKGSGDDLEAARG